MDTVSKSGRGATASKARRGAAAALAIAAALTAGCTATRTPPARTASARPVAVTSSTGTSQPRPVPPVFVASLAPAKPRNKPSNKPRQTGDRLALFSSRTGHLLRWLTTPPDQTTDQALSMRGDWVYFVRSPIAPQPGAGHPATQPGAGQTTSQPASPAVWRVRVTGGPAQLVQAGASDYAISPDGRAVAYVTSTGRTVDIVARNLITGRRNTIVLATRPDPRASNWPPEVSGLSWASDNSHVAVQFELTAAISSVLTFGAFTAATISDGRTGPPPCPAATHDQCAESDPAYLADGTLSYVIQRLNGSGAVQASLVTWQASHPATTTLLSFPATTQPQPQPQPYDMTAPGQAIWASPPPRPQGRWTVWRWSGGPPEKLTTLAPYYGVDAIAW